MVDECSSADTGVGPAMASGSQVCSGNWPDLPIAAMNSATPAQSRMVLLASPDSAQPGDGEDREAVAAHVLVGP